MREITEKVIFMGKKKKLKVKQFTSLNDAGKHLGQREVRKMVNEHFRQHQLDAARRCWGSRERNGSI